MRTHHLVALVLLCASPCGCSGSSTPTAAASETQADGSAPAASVTFPVVDTGQTKCYDTLGATVSCDSASLPGQDASHAGHTPSYSDRGDGTVADNVTGLVWQKTHSAKMAYAEAASYCDDLSLGGATDWRVPTIKELYSLIDFDGATGTFAGDFYTVPANAVPYIDTSVFDFEYGNTTPGDRFIDAQEVTSTRYVSKTFADNHGQHAGSETFFGVNFADGRIKGYPQVANRGWFVRCVGGASTYGANDFADNGDGTVSDRATGLMWMRDDSGAQHAGDQADGTMDWPTALRWCESISYAGYDDWRLPDAKELQSIVDYGRSPDTTQSAAIDPVFQASPITDEAGDPDYPWYWTGTTHLDGKVLGTDAVYVAFGEALGYVTLPGETAGAFLDVHGAGAQRGDPKSGARNEYPQWGMGPQGDVRRVFNFARCVRTQL